MATTDDVDDDDDDDGRRGGGTFCRTEEARYIYKLLLVLMLFLPYAAGKSNFIFILNGIFPFFFFFFFVGGWGSGIRLSFSGKEASAFEAIRPSTTFHSVRNVPALVR